MTIYTKYISYRVYICHHIQHTECACMCIHTYTHTYHAKKDVVQYIDRMIDAQTGYEKEAYPLGRLHVLVF